MAAYIDEHRSRFRVGPICRVLSESLDCGFLTPRGCRMFRTRPVSRMRAGREALARAVLQIRSDFFMAVYGCGKMHAQLVACVLSSCYRPVWREFSFRKSGRF